MRWLTANELAIELGCDVRSIYSLHKKGQLQAVGTTPKSTRYLDPGPELAKRIHLKPIDTAALITSMELAEIMGVKHDTIRQWIARDQLKADLTTRSGHFFNRITVREVLARRDGRRGRRKYVYSPILMRWLRGWLNTQQASVQVLDSLIHEVAANVPDPEKTVRIKRLWDLFEEVNQILKLNSGN